MFSRFLGGVQELGSEALARLYAENPDMTKLFATAATVESVLTALQTHPNEHEVQARGFWLLEELTRTPRKFERPGAGVGDLCSKQE